MTLRSLIYLSTNPMEPASVLTLLLVSPMHSFKFRIMTAPKYRINSNWHFFDRQSFQFIPLKCQQAHKHLLYMPPIIWQQKSCWSRFSKCTRWRHICYSSCSYQLLGSVLHYFTKALHPYQCNCVCSGNFAGSMCNSCRPNWYGNDCSMFSWPCKFCNGKGRCRPKSQTCEFSKTICRCSLHCVHQFFTALIVPDSAIICRRVMVMDCVTPIYTASWIKFILSSFKLKKTPVKVDLIVVLPNW